MLQSKLFVKTSKTPPADADSVNARLLTQGGFVSKQMAGVYTFLPLGLNVLQNIQTIIREEMNALGAVELLMPALTPLEAYEATGRDAIDILFHLTGHGEVQYVLNQSHEEVIAPLMKKHILSYKDLPVAAYQIQNKYRNEPRAKSGILRGREFNMKDLYSFHADEADLDTFYEKVKKAYFKIYERVGIGDRTVLTYASGGTFSKYSHEFQTISHVGEDTIYLCERCHVAVNKEIIHEQTSCPECGSTKLTERHSIEVGNIFKLGTRFSKAVDLTYADKSGAAHPVIMACYGIGPSRLMGTLVEIFHDEKGIIWPESVAPFHVHLVGLDMDTRIVRNRAQRLYERLQKKGVRVLFDDRAGVSVGAKLAEADLLGIPWRAIVSNRTKAKVELKRRDQTKATLVSARRFLSRMHS